MKKLFEKPNPYVSRGFVRNPFVLEVEPERFADIAFRREANRVFFQLVGQQRTGVRRPLVVEVGDISLDEQIRFFSHLFRTFLNAPAGDWFVFDMPAHMIRAREARAGAEAIRARLFEPLAPRLFYSYAYERLAEVDQAGALGDRLPTFEDPKAFLEQVRETKGKALADVLFWKEEEAGAAAGSAPAGAEPAAAEDSPEDPAIELARAMRSDLSRLLMELIEADDIGESVKGALRTFVQAGPEIAIGNFLPRHYRDDLTGLLALLGEAYSNTACLIFGLDALPALVEEDVADVDAVISELEAIIKRNAQIIYQTPTPYDELHAVFFDGKPSVSVDLRPEFLAVERPDADAFLAAVLYLVGAFPAQDDAFLKDVESAATRAFEAADGEYDEALGLLADAFDAYAAGVPSLVDSLADSISRA